MRSVFLKGTFEDVYVWTQLLWQAMVWLCSFGCRGIKTVSMIRIAKLNSGGTGSET